MSEPKLSRACMFDIIDLKGRDKKSTRDVLSISCSVVFDSKLMLVLNHPCF